MTTNRYTAIDPAFKSRLDLILPFEDLDSTARRSIWKTFLDRVPPKQIRITDEDVEKLAEWKLNGREIKNMVKTSRLLAASMNSPLLVEHIQRLRKIREKADALESTLC